AADDDLLVHEVDADADDEGEEAEHGGDGGEQDGAQADHTSGAHGLAARHASALELVGEVDEHDGVVDDHAGQADDADAGHDDAEGHLIDHQGPQHADEAQDDAGEDDERLADGVKLGDEDQHDDEQGDEQRAAEELTGLF